MFASVLPYIYTQARPLHVHSTPHRPPPPHPDIAVLVLSEGG